MLSTANFSAYRAARANMTSSKVTIKSGTPFELRDKSALDGIAPEKKRSDTKQMAGQSCKRMKQSRGRSGGGRAFMRAYFALEATRIPPRTCDKTDTCTSNIVGGIVYAAFLKDNFSVKDSASLHKRNLKHPLLRKEIPRHKKRVRGLGRGRCVGLR